MMTFANKISQGAEDNTMPRTATKTYKKHHSLSLIWLYIMYLQHIICWTYHVFKHATRVVPTVAPAENVMSISIVFSLRGVFVASLWEILMQFW